MKSSHSLRWRWGCGRQVGRQMRFLNEYYCHCVRHLHYHVRNKSQQTKFQRTKSQMMIWYLVRVIIIGASDDMLGFSRGPALHHPHRHDPYHFRWKRERTKRTQSMPFSTGESDDHLYEWTIPLLTLLKKSPKLIIVHCAVYSVYTMYRVVHPKSD